MTVMGMCSRLRCRESTLSPTTTSWPEGSSDSALSPQILGLPVATLRAKLSEHSGYVPLAYQVDGAVEAKVAALDLPYVSFIPDVARTDPDGNLFSPVLGIVGFGGRALSGLEYMENSLLAGSPGSEVVPTGPNGEGLPGTPTDVVAARQGTSLVLTLDEPLQFEVTKDLSQQITFTHATGGVAIVEDRRTGGILAMVDLVAGPHGKVVPANKTRLSPLCINPVR